ncbi:ferroxidase fet3 [Coemansia asiatica]|uniref:Ferroxidase fet3 n=1 Tax=Coemansia asiatica TaxID=1052880 RepID=A0A9W7XG25_9FUNG|nr:ferroxidase fet3 [Coemansia asiatica]
MFFDYLLGRTLLSAGICGAVFLQTVLAANIIVDWDIGYITVNRDGYFTRRAIGVNGKLPIPPVRATIGDTIYLNVHNSLDKSTSIHAHGLFQRDNNFMDGPAMVTQCGIPPGESHTYIYKLEQTGTFWIHGHDHHQNSDGLRAPLVVYDRKRPPFEYKEDILFSVEDWYLEEFAEREKQTLDPSLPFPPPHGYGFGLIDGYNGNLTKPLYFKPGNTYRLRFVNMGALTTFQFTLPGHRMRVVEIDGVYTEPSEVDGITIAPAQRYSVLIDALKKTQFNYHYNITMFAEFIPPKEGLTPRVYIGDVIYRKNAPFKNIRSEAGWKHFNFANDITLSSLDGEPAMPVNRRLEYTVGNNLYSTGQHLDYFNNITYAQPLVPTLYTALTMGKMAMDERVYGPQTHAVVLKHMEVVEITIHNPNTMPHPLHLHGHVFQIVEYGLAKAPFPIPDKFKNIPTVRYTGSCPSKRDTMLIPTMNYIKIRLRADNPGVWIFHCHLDIHHAMGMAMTFVEAPDVLQKTQRVPRRMLDFCRKLGKPFEGNAAGNSGLDFTGLPAPPTIVARSPVSTGRALAGND